MMSYKMKSLTIKKQFYGSLNKVVLVIEFLCLGILV